MINRAIILLVCLTAISGLVYNCSPKEVRIENPYEDMLYWWYDLEYNDVIYSYNYSTFEKEGKEEYSPLLIKPKSMENEYAISYAVTSEESAESILRYTKSKIRDLRFLLGRWSL